MKKEQTIKKDIKKLRQNKQFLAILILLFVSLLFWVIISLITSQTSKKIDPEIQQLSRPLTPVINTEVFDTIEAKKEYTESELSAFTIFKVLLGRDGKTERVVPIEVTIDDLEPKETPQPTERPSLLDDLVLEGDSETTNQEPAPTAEPSSSPTTLLTPPDGEL